jgi:uncharacterized damage-inducible protein DinB
MMSLYEPLLTELQQESATTRRLLERLPEGAFSWKPHEKSMSMGHLAVHIARLLQLLNSVLNQDDYDIASSGFGMMEPDSRAGILDLFDRALDAAGETLKKQPDERLLALWRMRNGEQVIFQMPRTSVIRTMILNHITHHRGQLSVYLRLQNVPLPPIYGPTADETPKLP